MYGLSRSFYSQWEKIVKFIIVLQKNIYHNSLMFEFSCKQIQLWSTKKPFKRVFCFLTATLLEKAPQVEQNMSIQQV